MNVTTAELHKRPNANTRDREQVLEQLAWGRYLCHIKSAWLMISIEIIDRPPLGRPYLAVIEITRYKMRVNDDGLYHDLIARRTVPGINAKAALTDAVAKVNKYLNDEGLGQMRLEGGDHGE